jgi:hypothetical protein
MAGVAGGVLVLFYAVEKVCSNFEQIAARRKAILGWGARGGNGVAARKGDGSRSSAIELHPHDLTC